MKKFRTPLFYIPFAIFVGICILGAVYWYLYISHPQKFTVNEASFNAHVAHLEPGDSVANFLSELEQSGVIRSKKIVLTIIQKRKFERLIKTGTYVFTGKDNAFELIDRLITGQYGYTPVKVTIPEGYSVKKIGHVLHEKMPAFDEVYFFEKALSQEGYLFPDTYFLYPYSTPEQIISIMKNNTERHIYKAIGTTSLDAQIEISGHGSKTVREIVIMASILEKEVIGIEDKSLASDLFWRRIAIGMPLQADSTLTYEINKTSAQMTLADLQKNSPYNTYTNKGLPPTPISNPGIESIKAVLNPTPNKYLFFLTDEDNTAHFSETYQEHLRLKQKYLP